METLNHKLKMEMSLYIYEDRYNRVKFFRGRQPSFICWLCPLMKPTIYYDQQYIYLEGDDVSGIYFMVTGNASFVLPSFRNTSYINVLVGDHFGVVDIVSSAERKQFELEKWYEKRS